MPKLNDPLPPPETAPLSDLESVLAEAGAGIRPREGPLWRGPEIDGVTYSLLSRFLVCRERFRLLVVEGLRTDDFNARIEFGNMWHAAEAAHAGNKSWENAVKKVVQPLLNKHPIQRDQIAHYYDICRATFAEYLNYWAEHENSLGRVPLFQEQEFAVPYPLPSGRTVLLRGKWDAGEVITRGPAGMVNTLWLPEHKTKSGIDEGRLVRQLSFDLQTMIYVVAFLECQKNPNLFPAGLKRVRARLVGHKFAGVLYNVICRSAHKNTAADQKVGADGFYHRLRGLIRTDIAKDGTDNRWFARWRVEVGNDHVQRFRRRCLDPILEQLCDWWGYIKNYPTDPFAELGQGQHWHYQFPYGVYNIIAEGGMGDVDGYMLDGNPAGLTVADDLFPELTNKTA